MMDPSKILVIAPNWVGDSVFMLPAVTALKRRFPGSHFTLLASSSIAALHAGSPCFDEFIALRGSRRSLARFKACWGLRRRQFDLCVVFPNSFSWGLAAWLSGARRRLGRPGQGRGFLLNLKSPLPPADRLRHSAEEYMDLARLAGARPEPQDMRPRLVVSAEARQERDRLFKAAGLGPDLPLVALCPTSAYGPSKMWPIEKFLELAKMLIAAGLRPVAFCAPSETPALDALRLGLPELALLTPSLPGLAACLGSCAAVVANDSGPLHIAAAVGAPSLGLYGPVHPRWSSPLAEGTRVLYTDEPCSPCYARTCPLGHHNCLNKIDADSVYQVLSGLLGR